MFGLLLVRGAAHEHLVSPQLAHVAGAELPNCAALLYSSISEALVQWNWSVGPEPVEWGDETQGGVMTNVAKYSLKCLNASGRESLKQLIPELLSSILFSN
jgi:hypothetical protein